MRSDRVHLRVARPTDQLELMERMYRDGLGFVVLGRFEDHEGFDGVMLGDPGGAYHLEFTHQRGHRADRAPSAEKPSAEHLLVFYLDPHAAFLATCERMRIAGFVPVTSGNPFWERHGRTFEDADGYRIVLHDGPWR